MHIDLTFDQNPNWLPPGFVMDVEYVAKLFDALFSNNVTIKMDIGFGEVRGVSIDPDFIGEPDPSHYYTESYAAVRKALIAQGAPGASTLPLSSPLPGSLRLAQAQAKALGFTTQSGVDAYVGFSANALWSYAIPGQPSTGTISRSQNECVSLIEHEFSEAMGRRSDLQGEVTYAPGQIFYGLGQPTYYTPMDLYRYRGLGVIDTPKGELGHVAYFSLDNGRSQLGIFDSTVDWLDHGDWYPSGPTSNGNDAFDAFPKTGVVNPLSETDLRLMAAIGWTTSAEAPELLHLLYADTFHGQGFWSEWDFWSAGIADFDAEVAIAANARAVIDGPATCYSLTSASTTAELGVTGGSLTVTSIIKNGGIIRNAGRITVGSLINSDLIQQDAGSDLLSVLGSTDNTGRIIGPASFDGVVSGTGHIEIIGRDVFGKDVDSRQTIDFIPSDTNNSIVLKDPASFAAEISGFEKDCEIVAGGFDSGTKFTYRPSDLENTAGMLTLTFGDHVAHLHFDGVYAAADFSVVSGANATTIRFV
jgi:hypothetical protein